MPHIYHDPAALESSVPVYWARLEFFGRIAALIPDVLTRLRDDVLPVFQATWQDTDPAHLRQWRTLRTMAGQFRAMPDARRRDAVIRLGADPVPLVDALTAWGAQWNLSDDWCADVALSTLRWWANVPETLTSESGLSWHPGGIGTWVVILDVPPLDAWKPNIESWEAFSVRVDEWKKRNRGTAEATAAAAGMTLPPEKRARSSPDRGRDFEMLARFQVQGWTQRNIAGTYRTPRGHQLTEKAVADALRRTADMIGLTRRSTPPE
jgi:hypothetical protein